MSDWFRTLDPLSLLGFALVCLGWAAGGWLAARAWFTLRPGERLVTGAAAGFVAYLTLVNWLTPLAGLGAAIWLGSGLVLAAGLGAAWRAGAFSPAGRVELRSDLRDWPQLAAVLALALLLESTLRGISLFDEYIHLPMISVMAAGEIPPRFYLNPDLTFAYHYALQIFAAALVSLARFFPWSAWDASRGLAFGFTAVLGYLWVRRLTGRPLAGALGALALILGGGARWLLLLLPGRVLNWVSGGVQLANSGLATALTLAEAMPLPWAVEGGGAVPFPFAFRSGVFTPQSFALGSSGTLPALTVLLLLLLARPFPSLRRPAGLAVLTVIFANLALSAEYFYPFLAASIVLAGLVAVLRAWRRKERPPWEAILAWAAVLAASALLSAVQGGYLTETARNLLLRLQGQGAAASNLYGFALRWPPAIYSLHLGSLNPFNPAQLVALLAETGPALLAAPLATWLTWRSIRRGDWLTAGMGLAALLSMLFTLFAQYGMDTSSPRFSGTALWLWLLLALPLLWRSYQRGGTLRRAWLGGLYGILLVGGIVTFGVQLSAIPAPVPSVYIASLDQAMARKYWNTLEPGAQVLDYYPERAVAVFGRISKAKSSLYVPLPEWETLIGDPTPQKAAAAGYSYVYMDPKWWEGFSPELRQGYLQPCVRLVGEIERKNGSDWRRLYDVSDCK